jgi:zinc and cadmium transporter
MLTFYILISVIIVSLISLIGVLGLSFKEETIKKVSLTLVSFAVGALFGDALIHLLPEAFKRIDSSLLVSLLIISGLLLFFVMEKFLRWRHCHVPEDEPHVHPVVAMNMVGSSVHNFIDGMLIAASYFISFPLGLSTTLAIVFHEIPNEISHFGVLIHGGLTARKAVYFNFLTALFAVFGALIFIVIGHSVQNLPAYLLPVTAGGFLYIAGSDLVPELHHETKARNSAIQFIMIVFGVGVMAGLLLLE